MSDSSALELRSGAEIREHLVTEFNLALRRPGMYGRVREFCHFYSSALSFVSPTEGALWQKENDRLELRGAWSPIGIEGPLLRALGATTPWRVHGEYEHAHAAVYAELARRAGWLRPDRTLSAEEYADTRSRLTSWCAEDRSWDDVQETFGAPSLLVGGTNPRCGKTVSYVTADPADPMISFHLWRGTWPPDQENNGYGPILLAGQCGDGMFNDTFALTPFGAHRKEVLEAAE